MRQPVLDEPLASVTSTPLLPQSSDAAVVNNAAIARTDRNLPAAPAARRPIREIATAAVCPDDVAKTAITQQPFTFPASDTTPGAEIGADVYVDCNRGRGRRHGDWSEQ